MMEMVAVNADHATSRGWQGNVELAINLCHAHIRH